MPLPIHIQGRYWGIAAILFFIALWFLGSVLLPFLVAGAVAYFLDPVADRLQRLGLSRAAATTIITLVAVMIVVLLVLAVIPVLVQQLTALINATPEMARQLEGFVTRQFPDMTDSTSVMRRSLAQIASAIQAKGGAVAQGLLNSVLGVVSWVLFIVVVPVVAFYLLMDWDHLVARVDDLLPRDHAPVVRQLAREVDAVLAGFVRGQLTVCLTLGLYYAVALMSAGLQFGLIVGAIAGVITVIPFVGALIGGTLAIGIAFYQFWGDWLHIGIIATIFAFGQFMEGNVLTPRLVGKSVGLHPVWLMLALSIFGAIFGFVGLLIAVPVAASIGVIARFALNRYRESPLYQGITGKDDSDLVL
ncbi:MAG: AI-2E family transporter [Candidatus Saccharibacteria bacterium]|nr:AI-2E family transporter [Pseudorhodobacter sp.]